MFYKKYCRLLMVQKALRAEFNLLKRGERMETRIALIGIIVENMDVVENVNQILHEYGQYIVGRMGIPYKEKKVSIISIVIDAENNVISSLSGKLGMLNGISVKTVYSKYGK